MNKGSGVLVHVRRHRNPQEDTPNFPSLFSRYFFHWEEKPETKIKRFSPFQEEPIYQGGLKRQGLSMSQSK